MPLPWQVAVPPTPPYHCSASLAWLATAASNLKMHRQLQGASQLAYSFSWSRCPSRVDVTGVEAECHVVFTRLAPWSDRIRAFPYLPFVNVWSGFIWFRWQINFFVLYVRLLICFCNGALIAFTVTVQDTYTENRAIRCLGTLRTQRCRGRFQYTVKLYLL